MPEMLQLVGLDFWKEISEVGNAHSPLHMFPFSMCVYEDWFGAKIGNRSICRPRNKPFFGEETL